MPREVINQLAHGAEQNHQPRQQSIYHRYVQQNYEQQNTKPD